MPSVFGIKHKPYSEQMAELRRGRGLRKLSPSDAAMIEANQKRIKQGNYLAQKPQLGKEGGQGPTAARKRPADSESTENPPTKRQMLENHRLMGLDNSREACFSNAAIQVIDASLSNEQVTQLHSNDMSRPNSFSLSEAECIKHKQTMKILKQKIQDAAGKGHLSLSAYLGQLLKDLRSDPIDPESRKGEHSSLSAFMLQ